MKSYLILYVIIYITYMIYSIHGIYNMVYFVHDIYNMVYSIYIYISIYLKERKKI